MLIFKYLDYREFLLEFIERLPKKGRGEINRMAKAVGVHPSLLSQVLSQLRNLNLEQAQLLCAYLNLTQPETEHFMLMVQYQRAGTLKLQGYFKEKLKLSKQASLDLSQHVRQDQELSEEEKSVFYSHWIYIAVWLFTSVSKGQSLESICSYFKIHRKRAGEILQFLEKTQLCQAKNGVYSMGSQSIHLARGSPHLARHHTAWRLRAVEASDRISSEEMMFTAPLSVSKEDFKKIRSRLTELIKEVTEVALESEAQDLACFNLDFFWIKSSLENY